MKEWLTAKELAAERLPELPTTKRAIRILAEREGWNDNPSLARRREARGGGMEYHISILPTLAQMAYRQTHLKDAVPASDLANDNVRDCVSGVSGKAALERDARIAVVKAFERLSAGLNLAQASKRQIFVDKYNTGALAVDDWVRDILPKISKRSLERWAQAEKSGKINALAVDRSKARSGRGILDIANGGRVRAFILALIAKQPHLSAANVRIICRDEFGDRIEGAKGMVNMPPVRTFQHALKRLKEDNKTALIKLTNPDKFRSELSLSGVGSLRHISEVNALWQIDASPVDALCIDGRYSLYACIDIATRRTIITLSKTPRASAVALMIRKAILAWGVPHIIKTDNGSDFVAKDTKRLFVSLGIEMDISDAYQPQQKGHVERVIGTFQRDVGPLLPGFIGHSVADRKAIEARRSFAARLGESDAEIFGVELTADELQGKVDEWLEKVYEHRSHSGLKGQTPFQVAAASVATIKTVDERALDLLLMPAAGKDGYRVVTKFGIRIEHRQYLAPEIMPGTRVFVRQDPADLGRVLAYSDDGGAFLGEGICPEYSGIHPETFVKAAKEIQAEKLAEATREIKRDMREISKGPALIERVLNVASRDVPNIVSLPKPETRQETPEISAALDAAVDRTKRRAPMSESANDLHKQLLADQAEKTEETPAAVTSTGSVTRLPETPAQRYRRALDLQAQIDAGESPHVEDLLWLGGYRETPEFKTQKIMAEEFGNLAPGMRS